MGNRKEDKYNIVAKLVKGCSMKWKTYDDVVQESDESEKWYVAKHPCGRFEMVRFCNGCVYTTTAELVQDEWLYFGEIDIEMLDRVPSFYL